MRVESWCSNTVFRGLPLISICRINGDKMIHGISVNNSEIEGLASLSISGVFPAFDLTNGMVAKTEISASYRHVSTKILIELPQVFEKVSYELGNQRDRFRLSLESPVDDPMATLERFNKQFALKEPDRGAITWACLQEAGQDNCIISSRRVARQMMSPCDDNTFLTSLEYRVGDVIISYIKS